MTSKGFCSVPGVKANGVEIDGKGLAILETPGVAVGTFTKNTVQAAPVVYSKELLDKDPNINHIIINSGCANAFTGDKGYKDAEWMSSLIEGRNIVCSTGKIGPRIDRDWVSEAAGKIKNKLGSDPEKSKKAAEAILTTDTMIKQVSIDREGYSVGGFAKGAGMIEPDMGTMLAFIFTDIEIPYKIQQERFKNIVNRTFNMVVVDGDTSTNDTALLTSTGKTKTPYNEIKEELWSDIESVCQKLAKKIARDGEGSTKMMEINIKKAKTKKQARYAAKAILNSPLVKTAIYGEDPNFGRIVAALGRSKASFDKEKFKVNIGNHKVISEGKIIDFNTEKIKEELEKEKIKIDINLEKGSKSITGWGCDLTPKYVEINSQY